MAVRLREKRTPVLRPSSPRPILVQSGMNLRDLFAGVDTVNWAGHDSDKISSVCCDSRRVIPGALFFALHGAKDDGHRFVSDAVHRGAVAIASSQPHPPENVPANVAWIQVADPRKALALVSANFYAHPAKALQLVGITGTNGKTTTAFLVDSILRAAGHKAGLFGTVLYKTPRGEYPAPNTTPESVDLQRLLAEIRDAGGTAATLEISSHSLALDRVWGCPFAVAVFTNLTRDHLDYHKTLDDYFAAKRRLFDGTGAGAPRISALNTDDPRGRELLDSARAAGRRTLSYGLENGAQVTTKKFALSFIGLSFTAQTPSGNIEIHSPFVARINVYNILAAIAAALALEIPPDKIAVGISALHRVPGRFERVDLGQPFLVIIDYAHTHDAFQTLIETTRELNPGGRVITLFGCGGGKDRTKRPLMGEVAGSLSDLVVLTSDNPRTEDPIRIMNDVIVGLQKANANFIIEQDRETAIEHAIDSAKTGDVILLCGKGHENYQILADRTLEFNEREIVTRILRQRGFGP